MQRTHEEWEVLLNLSEDRREIKNAIGKLSQSILLCLDDERDKLISNRDDICLGLNDGWYVGRDGVYSFLEKRRENLLKKADVLRKIFPGKLGSKSLEEIYGVGTLNEKPCGCPIISPADDRKTAKAMWYSSGSNTDITERGPLAMWTLGCFAADMVWEDNEWKFWHVLYFEDLCFPVGCSVDGQSIDEKFPKLPEFAELEGLKDAEPTIRVKLHERYSAMRPFTKTPAIPCPYDTFANTVSYGYREV